MVKKLEAVKHSGMSDNVDRYVEDLTGLLEDESATYEVFKNFYPVVAQSFDSAVSREVTFEQLGDIAYDVSNDSLPPLPSNQDSGRNMLETTADVYDDLGFISSDVKTFSGEKFYKIPNYNGRGWSKSWEDIVEEVEQAIDLTEQKRKVIQRREENRNLEEWR